MRRREGIQIKGNRRRRRSPQGRTRNFRWLHRSKSQSRRRPRHHQELVIGSQRILDFHHRLKKRIGSLLQRLEI
jgi:hypothetical protein